jgi:plastocyanin
MTPNLTLRTRFHALAILLAVVTLTVMCGTSARADQATPPAKTVAIDIDNFKFGIVSLKTAVGTTVTWTNRDDVPHTVMSSDKLFKSPPLDTGDSFSYTFKTAGTFEYYCSMHPRMTGKIVVK